jgi:DNA-binding response OmpR family regulator
VSLSESKILEDISTSIPGVIYQFLVKPDGSWSFPYVSKGIESLFEVTSEDASQDPDVMTLCIIDEDRPSHRQSVENAVKNIAPWHHEHRILTRSGVMKWILATALPRRLEDGSILWNGILTDITEVMELKLATADQNNIHHQQMQAIADTETRLRKHHNLLAEQISDSPLMTTNRLKILIVEDETLVREALVRIFTHFGYDVRGVRDGKDMDAALAEYTVDIIVLDINLPGEDGIRIARRIRNVSSCGIIMMTGHKELDDKLNAYNSGADIYFTKPVDPEELHGAIESLGRRLSPASKPGWYFDGVRSLLITPRNIAVPLSSQQAIVLELLTRKHGEAVPRSELLIALGHTDDEYADQRLETLLSRLRLKVRKADPESQLPVRSRQGIGYAFLDEVQQQA